jgi:phospholipid/cholesterol/gamma-HCH transport system substrate-binding protein
MRISSEVKIGFIGLITLIVLIWGINYLKGRNILKSTFTLHAYYDHAQSLESSAPVMMTGIKIGYVDKVTLRTDRQPAIEVNLSIEKDFSIPKGSQAILYSIDLLGTKGIRIEASDSKVPVVHNDTLKSLIESDLLSSIETRLEPTFAQISSLASTVDSLASGVHALLITESTQQTLDHLSQISGALKNSLGPGGSLSESFKNLESFSSVLKEQGDEVTELTSNLNSISKSLDQADVGRLLDSLQSTTLHINRMLTMVNDGSGSLGRFVTSDTLHENLNRLIADLDKLILDLNENPQRYVQFSLFGNSQKNNR